MRAPDGWIKTARRASVYYRRNSMFWIFRSGDRWELVRRLPSPEGWESFGKFPTLTDAANYYDMEVTA
jgi:hypothetical protein